MSNAISDNTTVDTAPAIRYSDEDLAMFKNVIEKNQACMMKCVCSASDSMIFTNQDNAEDI